MTNDIQQYIAALANSKNAAKAAATAIIEMGTDVIPTIITAFEDKSLAPKIHKGLVPVLGNFVDDERIVAALIERYKDAEGYDDADIDGIDTVTRLMNLIIDSGLQRRAAQALFDELQSTTGSHRPELGARIAFLGIVECFDILLNVMDDSDPNVVKKTGKRIRARSYELDDEQTNEFAQKMVQRLVADNNPAIRAVAANHLGNFRPKHPIIQSVSVPALNQSINDISPEVVASVKDALEMLGYPVELRMQPCFICERTQSIEFKVARCLECGTGVCEEHWVTHNLAHGVFCSEACRDAYVSKQGYLFYK